MFAQTTCCCLRLGPSGRPYQLLLRGRAATLVLGMAFFAHVLPEWDGTTQSDAVEFTVFHDLPASPRPG